MKNGNGCAHCALRDEEGELDELLADAAAVMRLLGMLGLSRAIERARAILSRPDDLSPRESGAGLFRGEG